MNAVTKNNAWNLHGKLVFVGKCGEAFTMEAFYDGKSIYQVFADMDSLEAWIKDNSWYLDSYETSIRNMIFNENPKE